MSSKTGHIAMHCLTSKPFGIVIAINTKVGRHVGPVLEFVASNEFVHRANSWSSNANRDSQADRCPFNDQRSNVEAPSNDRTHVSPDIAKPIDYTACIVIWPLVITPYVHLDRPGEFEMTGPIALPLLRDGQLLLREEPSQRWLVHSVML